MSFAVVVGKLRAWSGFWQLRELAKRDSGNVHKFLIAHAVWIRYPGSDGRMEHE
jgi:hypothetical protein